MLLRQLFNHPTFSYTYVLADPSRNEAALIDPVRGKMRDYVQLFNELGLELTVAIDTHTHDDQVSGLQALRDLWNCETIAGAPSDRSDVSRVVSDGDIIEVGSMQLMAMHTPGHTEDSYSFLIEQPDKCAVFTGDTLLVRTVGLSNQPTSNIREHYESLSKELSTLPDDTLIYPGRDFKGWPLSTIREEKAFNPYLLCADMGAFIELKEKQQPAHIRPVLAFHERDETDESYLEMPGARPDEPSAPDPDYYLPGEKGLRSIDNSEPGEEKKVPSWR